MKNLKSKAFWEAAASRAIRTFCQGLLGGYVGGRALEDIEWKAVFSIAAAAAIFSIINSIITGLPEVEE